MITADIAGRNLQNLSYGYYLHNFNPRKTALLALSQDRIKCADGARTIFVRGLNDGGALYEYAKIFGFGLTEDIASARAIIDRGGCLYVAERGNAKSPRPLMKGSPPIKPLDDGKQYYRLYLMEPGDLLRSRYQVNY